MALSGVTIAALMVAPCPLFADTFLEPAGQIASDQRSHLLWVTGITMIAVIPVFVLLPLILLRYRRGRSGATYKPRWEYSLPLEITMWGVPLFLVGVLSLALWQSTHKLDPYKPIEGAGPPVNVQVVGLDWKWLFIYPDLGIASVGELAIPVDQPVAMTLTTDTVMQSFIISSLAGQIYAMPGMTTELHVMADTVGAFEGENTQYNGNGFVGQKFMTRAMDTADFDGWVQKVKSDGVALDEAAYGVLARQSSQEEAHKGLASGAMPSDAIWFTLPDIHLFHKIVGRYHTGKPLPLAAQPGTVEFSAATQEAAQ
ncbi:cytochrome O ubiquinol oxidase [Ruegeria sp. ANG-R]|nr:cytochrome O ubiquinol oxidase [Ruegeria sp. ANG-R]